MATEYISPNMGLVVPVPTQDPGPNWSYALNASLTILDNHNHTSGNGVQIPTAGININGNLSFNSYSALNLNVAAFASQPSAISPVIPYVACGYAVGANGELYWNDLAGNSVQITLNGSVAVSGSIGFTGLPSGTAAPNYLSGSGTFQFLQATSTAANLDVGSIAIRYPGSYPSPSGNYIQLQAPSSLASGYSLTLPGLPGQTNVMTLGNSGVISSVTWDQVAQNMSFVGADAIANSMSTSGANAIANSMNSSGASAIASSMGSTGANIIAGNITSVSSGVANLFGTSMNSTGANAVANTRTRAIGNSAPVGGIMVTSGSGIFTTSSTSPTPVTNLTGSISTSGKPVIIGLEPDPSNFSNIPYIAGTYAIVIIKNLTTGFTWQFTVSVSATLSTAVAGGVRIMDTVPAGTYTYQTQAYVTNLGNISLSYIIMYGYEL